MDLHIVHIKGREGVLAGSMAVAMREGAQLLKALRNCAGKAVLPGHVRVQQDVLGRLPLVAAVGAPQLLHLWPEKRNGATLTLWIIRRVWLRQDST